MDICNLEEIDGTYDIIVTCTGLVSRQLVNDPELYPRVDNVVLHGTADLGNWSTQVDPGSLVSKAIMGRCCMRIPKAEVVKEVEGLRSSINKVRLEVDEMMLKKSMVVHNYGHGGLGVTFFRGCC